MHTKNMEKNVNVIDLSNNIKKCFESDDNIVSKQISNGKIIIMYIDGICDSSKVTEYVINPLQVKKLKSTSIDDVLLVIEHPDCKQVEIEKVTSELTAGKCIVLVDDSAICISVGLDIAKERNISEPPTSAVLKGPREGFVENYKTNISLLRKILATNNFGVEYLKVGKYTNTNICIVYIGGVCDKKLIHKIKNKIEKINIDGIIDSNYVASFLEERPGSIFKQVGTSEKPDVVSAKLLEGRAAIIVDGSPIVLTLPFLLFEDLQNSDDYYSNNVHASLIRWLRLACCLITIMLPSLYLSVQLYHYKVLPLTFLITIINSTQNIPFTPFMEILFVLILFEILYEASLRMPQYLGIALSVVGALILGDTAVEAGLISSPAVMIVALSGITLYTIPDHTSQLSILRFGYTIIGGLLGFYGVIIFSIFLLIRLSDFDSYGSPYLAPYAPYVKGDTKDGMFKAHLTKFRNRPNSVKNINSVRMRNENDNK